MIAGVVCGLAGFIQLDGGRLGCVIYPRVRGSLFIGTTVTSNSGSIPARAGEPLSQQRPSAPCGVYPRACGGALEGSLHPTPSSGLSPRVRGSLLAHDAKKLCMGSIPARAGEP